MTSAIFLYSDLDLAIELKQFSYLYTWKDFHNFVDPSDSFDDKKPIFTQKINKKIVIVFLEICDEQLKKHFA